MLTKRKPSRKFKSANLTNLQICRNDTVLKERGQHGIREKIKTMALDTQANLAESDKGSLCKQRKWSEFYYGQFIIKSNQFVGNN